MEDLISLIIINYNNKPYIKRCVDSIKTQNYKKLEVIFIDNKSNDGSYEYFYELYADEPFIKVKNEINNGYSGAANQGISLSKGNYVMILNPDIIMESDFVEKLYKYIITDERIGAVSGKLLKYDFDKDKKLNYIDSTGIVCYENRRCIDRGQNETDSGQYEDTERVFGVCGAAPFYNKNALESIKIENEYFDEDFFAYKEDIDLSWRLNLAGYTCMYYPKAVAYHGRGMGGSKGGFASFIKNRKSQSKFLRGISFRNHIMMLIKNETKTTYRKHFLKILKREAAFIAYSLLYERFNFKYIIEALKFRHKMMEKRRKIMGKKVIPENELLELFKA